MINLLIFGTGKCSNRIENILHSEKVNIVGYLDNASAKWNTVMNNRKIFPPEEISNLDYDYIFIATIHYKEVRNQLQFYNVPDKKIIEYYGDISERLNEIEEFVDKNKLEYFWAIDKIDARLDNYKKIFGKRLENIEYEIADKIKHEEYFLPNICSEYETVDLIVNNRASLCRFGDGEFEIMEHRNRAGFQEADNTLAKRLTEVIKCENNNILIAIADNYGSLDKYTIEAADAIRIYMTENTRRKHEKYLKKDKQYHNAYITRPYIIFKDKCNAANRFRLIKMLWEKRDVTIIEGEYTRMGVGNELFNNVNSIKRIVAPNVNAFSFYNEILSEALKIDKERLILIALGPTATVLAYDMAVAGYQALDIGHIDIEYEWYLANVTEKKKISNKYVNEVHGGNIVAECNDKNYIEQIYSYIGIENKDYIEKE